MKNVFKILGRIFGTIIGSVLLVAAVILFWAGIFTYASACIILGIIILIIIYFRKKKLQIAMTISLAAIFVASSVFTYFDLFADYNKLEIEQQASFAGSYNSDNGYSWGANQNKLASIGKTIFTYEYDNSHLKNGNASATNQGKLIFYKVVDGQKTEIGDGPCIRPGHVLTDKLHNKVYYVTVEGTGEAIGEFGEDIVSGGDIRMYTFNYNAATKQTVLEDSEVVISADDTDGSNIRLGVAISETGDVMITYGSYNGYIYAFIKEYDQSKWAAYCYLSNAEHHSMMYCFGIIKNVQQFYILAVQDWNDWNNTGNTYYFYSKLFIFDGITESVPIVYTDEVSISPHSLDIGDFVLLSADGWSEIMVEDIRGTKQALDAEAKQGEYSQIVRDTEFILHDGKLHIILGVLRDSFWLKGNTRKYTHFVYENNELKTIKDNFDVWADDIRIAKYNGKLYYAYGVSLIGRFEIIEVDTGELVFKKTTGLFSDGTVFIDRYTEDSINLLYIAENATLFSFKIN